MYSEKKILPLCTVIVFCMAMLMCQNIFGQAAKPKAGFFKRRFVCAAGAEYSPGEKIVSSAAGINFSPQLFLTTVYSDFSFSVVLNLSGCYRPENNAEDLAEEIFFQMPAMLQLNMGHGASKDFYDPFGFFLGAGWHVQHDGSSTVNNFASEAGIRFWLLGKSTTLRAMYFPGNEKIFSSGKIISLQMNLGKYLEEVKRNNKVSNFMKPYRKRKSDFE